MDFVFVGIAIAPVVGADEQRANHVTDNKSLPVATAHEIEREGGPIQEEKSMAGIPGSGRGGLQTAPYGTLGTLGISLQK